MTHNPEGTQNGFQEADAREPLPRILKISVEPRSQTPAPGDKEPQIEEVAKATRAKGGRDVYAPVLDFARLVGSAGVIAHHVDAPAQFQNLLGSWDPLRVPLFLIISAYLTALSSKSKTWDALFLSRRLGTIVMPYVFWSIAYTFISLGTHSFTELKNWIVYQWPAYLFYGRAESHLYYLPLTGMVFATVMFLRKKEFGVKWLVGISVVCLLCNLALGSDPRVLSAERKWIVRFFYFAGIVGTFASAGTILALPSLRLWFEQSSRKVSALLVGVGISLTLLLSPYPLLRPVLFLFVPSIVTVGLLKFPRSATPTGKWMQLGKAYFGVYLVHMVFIRFAEMGGLTKPGALFDGTTISGPTLLVVLTFGLSLGFTLLFREWFPNLSWIVTGRPGRAARV